MRFLAVFLASVLISAGCATAIPQTARVSEALLVNTKPAQTKSIALTDESVVKDGETIPVPRGSRTPQEGMPGYIHIEATVFGTMLRDYAQFKFPGGTSGAGPALRVLLRDFWIEQYSTDSTATQVLAALGGGEINNVIIANLEVVYQLTRPSGVETNIVRVTGDSSHVQGFGTGTSTSRLYRGTDSRPHRVADAINIANNKALMLLNQWLDAQGL